jgi:carbohydrate diacid regulator
MLIQIAQKLADSISIAIGYEISIMDSKSVIIGASDRSRLGLVHEGTFDVFRSRKPVDHSDKEIQKLKNTKPGYQFPVFLKNEIIGAIGIVGPKHEVIKYADLIKIHAEIMVMEFVRQKSLIYTKQAKHNLIQEILSFNPKIMDEAHILSRGYMLGYDLNSSHIAIAINLLNMSKISKSYNTTSIDEHSSAFSIQSLEEDVINIVNKIFNANDLSSFVEDNQIIVLHSIPTFFDEQKAICETKEKCRKLINLLYQKKITLNIGLGPIAKKFEQVNRGYKNSILALKINSNNNEVNQIYHLSDYYIEALISNTVKDFSNWYMEIIPSFLIDHPDRELLSETIKCWCLSGFNLKKASEMLFIHRNTLNYRILKISKLSNMNLRNPKKAINLYLSILLIESKIESKL